MWFLLLSSGAVAVHLGGAALSRRLPVAPPPEALLAIWFLLAALLRLAVMRSRLEAYQRKARKLARRAADGAGGNDSLKHLGVGVGMGALQAVGGDLVGASLSLLGGLMKGVASSPSPQPAPQRERRRASRAEALRTVGCIGGVGLICAALAWWPLVGRRAERLGQEAAVAAGLTTADPPRTSPAPSPRAAPAKPASAGLPEATPAATGNRSPPPAITGPGERRGPPGE